MKKVLPYIAGALLLLLLLALLFGDRKDKFDHRITLNKKDKIPYGTYVAYNNLQHLFPEADIRVNKKEPGYWDYEVMDYDTTRQVLMIVTRNFNAFSSELTELFNFVSKGNDVFISAYNFSYEASDFFHIKTYSTDIGLPLYDFSSVYDTLELSLADVPFSSGKNNFKYPGRRYNSYFTSFDTSMSYVLGRGADNKVNCIKLRAGAGYFILHGAPLAFSNYFLLHKENMDYYNQLLSVLNPEARAVVWDEYYLHKTTSYSAPSPSPLRVLLSQPAFKMALYIALAGVLVYMLLGLKRNQRIFPAIKPPANDSLDFVKTVGRLYYQKGDNRNIAQKMTHFFVEHVHNRYHLTSGDLDEDFVERLSQRSGSPRENVQLIVDYIIFIREGNTLTNQQVGEFYNLLDSYYKTT
ncbi:MAG: DUF4350 domain-containing protein [Chitinophagaceae bacterium]|nr:DUF4350 domain-containing protein [Chitinophagaceae bacterium]MCW5927376.1 DUF4350 domain-containing protein [Chitinophagaceae bacterium]